MAAADQTYRVMRETGDPAQLTAPQYDFKAFCSEIGFDEVYEFDGLRLVVGCGHREYIRGLKIDFAEDLTGGAFRFDNPLATERFRCGYAFTIR